jgi:hypothetical protein
MNLDSLNLLSAPFASECVVCLLVLVAQQIWNVSRLLDVRKQSSDVISEPNKEEKGEAMQLTSEWFSKKGNVILALKYSTVLHVLYSVLQLEILVILGTLIEEHSYPTLNISVILCGKMVLVLCKLDVCSSFQEYVNPTNCEQPV